MRILFLILTLFTFSCREKVNHSVNKVTISFSGVGCEGSCPFHVVSVDTSLNLNYFGGYNTSVKGYYKRKISESDWDSIVSKFNKYLITGLDSTTKIRTDMPTVEFLVQNNKQKRYFTEDTGELSDRDLNNLYWIFKNLINEKSLIRSDSMNFETTLHKGIPVKHHTH